MQFDEMWNQLTRSKPKLNEQDSEIKIKSKNLRKLLYQFYKNGEQQKPNIMPPTRSNNVSSMPFDELFNSFRK